MVVTVYSTVPLGPLGIRTDVTKGSLRGARAALTTHLVTSPNLASLPRSRRNRPLLTEQMLLLILGLSSCGMGLLGIAWCRCSRRPLRASWGRRLFLLVLAVLAVATLLTAELRHGGLVYFGLAIGGLVIAMLWEGPRTQPAQQHWIPEEA